ncbi:MAG TPA: hypothetical protein VGR18_14400 [Rubrobacter sp.]|nr:hypothetical protein [Rubrobacter sp.]
MLLVGIVVMLPGGATAQPARPGTPAHEMPAFRAPAEETVVPGQIIVKYEETLGSSERAALRRQENLEKKGELGLIGAEVVKVRGQSVGQAVRDLERRPGVEYAEPNFRVYPTGFADEPRFSELWGLHNTGQTIDGSTGTANVDVNGKEASARTQGSPNLEVAVIDDGVDFSHPDLSARAWKNPASPEAARRPTASTTTVTATSTTSTAGTFATGTTRSTTTATTPTAPRSRGPSPPP